MNTKTSKTKIKSWARNKINPNVKEILSLALKSPAWHSIAKSLAFSTRKYPAMNLRYIDKHASAGDIVVIPGKILSQGNLTKKIKLVALSISQTAHEKLSESKSEFVSLIDEIKKNPKATGVKILK